MQGHNLVNSLLPRGLGRSQPTYRQFFVLARLVCPSSAKEEIGHYRFNCIVLLFLATILLLK
jgi:hypothetical protein